jgi:tetratricopeptide (TPR) repeat protein
VKQAEYLAFARAERANIDAALAWCAMNDPARGLQIAGGFGWAWIVLGDGRGAQRLLAALEAVGDTTPVRERANALLLAAWIEASSGHLGPAREHIAEASELARNEPELEARCAYYLAYVVSHHGDWDDALVLTDRARQFYAGGDRPWDEAANALFASRAAISAGDVTRAAVARDEVERCLEVVDDPWLHVRREAMLGELARVERRFDDAVAHIGRAAETSARLGFLQTEAYQLTSLGRAQCQAGDYEAGAATLELGIARAEATGDVRLAALGRVHLGRVLRALGRNDEARAALEAAATFHREAGGGEQEALGDTLLAALDGDTKRLVVRLDEARREGNAAVEVFALDALARAGGDDALYLEADAQMERAAHFITERGRVDRHAGSRRRTREGPP